MAGSGSVGAESEVREDRRKRNRGEPKDTMRVRNKNLKSRWGLGFGTFIDGASWLASG